MHLSKACGCVFIFCWYRPGLCLAEGEEAGMVPVCCHLEMWELVQVVVKKGCVGIRSSYPPLPAPQILHSPPFASCPPHYRHHHQLPPGRLAPSPWLHMKGRVWLGEKAAGGRAQKRPFCLPRSPFQLGLLWPGLRPVWESNLSRGQWGRWNPVAVVLAPRNAKTLVKGVAWGERRIQSLLEKCSQNAPVSQGCVFVFLIHLLYTVWLSSFVLLWAVV